MEEELSSKKTYTPSQMTEGQTEGDLWKYGSRTNAALNSIELFR